MTDISSIIQEFDKPEPVKDTGPYLMLSLFLLLLAFFILLNSISTREEEKSRAVLSSLGSTFRSAVEKGATGEVLVSKLGANPEPEDLIAEMKRLWITAIPITRVEVLTPGRKMEMIVPANKMFPGGESLLRKDREALFRAIGHVMSTNARGFVNELEIVLGTESVSAESLRKGGSNLELDRAIETAERLVKSGTPADTISVGIRRGNKRRVQMRFYVRDAGTRVDFRELVE